MTNLKEVEKSMESTKNKPPGDQSGFTLIEVMVAMVVLVVGVLGVLYMQLATVKGNSNAIGVSRAVHEASASLDMIEALDFTDSELDAGTAKVAQDLFGAGTMIDNLQGTMTYDVVELTAATLKTELGYADKFPGAIGKKIVVTSVQNVSGHSRTIHFELIKIDI
jgi:type IV pilus modification protein PilV